MPYCPECGADVGESASFCQECGHALNGESKDIDDQAATTGSQTSSTGGESADTGEEQEEEGINWGHAAKAVAVGFIPALGAYVGVSVAAYQAIGIVLVLGIPIFGYLLYQRSTVKAMVGGACFWLAIEAFLTPLALLIYTFAFASQESMTAAGQAGAAIGGIILVIVAFLVGFPIGVVLYLISRRLDVDADDSTSEPSAGGQATG
ncbi:zinc ribbon domain-containing protein [Haloplanus salinarum]|nr:zinc ribbon domain-containing protein [Haloplanus salinarum]